MARGDQGVYQTQPRSQRFPIGRQAGVRAVVRIFTRIPPFTPPLGLTRFLLLERECTHTSWSKPQLAARVHPRSLEIQKRLLTLFSSPPKAPVSLLTPLTYADRLRIRHPGDAKFALGPHMDGGSVERWEDEGYRKVYGEILRGNWEGFDAFQIGRSGTLPGGKCRRQLVQVVTANHRGGGGWSTVGH